MTRMYHVEVIKPKGDPRQLEEFLRRECLPYWREQGFEVHVYSRQYSLGDGPTWLITGLDHFADFDRWPGMATGDARGQELMQRLEAMIDDLHASVIRDVEAED
ncbi:MAG TPA: hypothetical protein VK449_10125 [Anaerolineales bacterium]|nr:hypothetical protein [Anaerolineales bacterium]